MRSIQACIVSLFVLLCAAESRAQEGLVVSFPDTTSGAVTLPTPGAPSVSISESSPLTVYFPSSGYVATPPASTGMAVGENNMGNMEVSLPNNLVVTLPPESGLPVSLSDDAGLEVTFPASSSPTISFPSSYWRPTVTIPGGGMTVGGTGDGGMVISFPGSSQPSIWLAPWEGLVVSLPAGGNLQSDHPQTGRTPLKLAPRAALALKLPRYRTLSLWFTRSWVMNPWTSRAN